MRPDGGNKKWQKEKAAKAKAEKERGVDMNFLITIGLWLIQLVTGPAVKAVAWQLLIDLGTVSKDVVKNAIGQAAASPATSGVDRLKLAASIVAQSYPQVANAAIYSVVTSVYREAYPTDPVVNPSA